jgi:DNA-3-methyladenine glycosylase II
VVDRLLAQLPDAVRRWESSDPVLARLARERPPRPVRGPRSSAFAQLVESLVHQQVSLAAGRTIFARLRASCGGRVTPERVLALGPRRLRACGLSRQKRDYVLDLARKVESKELDLRRLSRLADPDAVESLTQVRGIGAWTAKMFLLFHLQRPDVLAPDDLGLQIAAAQVYGIQPKAAKAFLAARAEAWSPYGSLASLTLWHARRTSDEPRA